MTANLVLHWTLDLISDQQQVIDETDNHQNGTVEGNPQVIPDAKFGSCIYLDGSDDRIVLAANDLLTLAAYTVEIWIKPDAAMKGWQGVMGKPGRDFNLWLNSDGFIHHRLSVGGDTNFGIADTPNGSIRWGEWQHVAIVSDGISGRTYINGEQMSAGTLGDALVPHRTPLILGSNLDDSEWDAYFKGAVAHARIYDGALSIDEIRRDMHEDEAALGAFVRTHPLDFNFYNEDTHHVLYIDDAPEGQTMFLDLINTSNQNIDLSDLGQRASSDTYHFALRFRPETLSQATLANITIATPGWSLDRTPDGTALYLLRTDAKSIGVGERVHLTLKGLSADGRAGTRGTRIELEYKNMRYAGEATGLANTRIAFLEIVNHRGLRDVPLHFGFVGGNTILSDGKTSSTLRIRIENTSRDVALLLNGSTSPDPSRFVFSFDSQAKNEVREWALVDYDNLDPVTFDVTAVRGIPNHWVKPPNPTKGADFLQWELMPAVDTQLDKDGYFVITISPIIAPLAIGHANLYIDYEDIPGYQNGRVALTVEKSPLIFSQPVSSQMGRIGIGRTDPEASLDINGSLIVRGFDLKLGVGSTERGSIGHARALVADNRSTLTINYNSDFTGGVTINGPTVRLNAKVAISTTDNHLQLRRESTQTTGGNILFLELYQDTKANINVYPSIRFHHNNKFWKRIEARLEGFFFKEGNLSVDTLVNIRANRGIFADLQVGNSVISEAELIILKRLAAGTLEFDLYNTYQQEYIYAADYAPYDNDRRRVFTWRTKNETVSQGRWRIHFPG